MGLITHTLLSILLVSVALQPAFSAPLARSTTLIIARQLASEGAAANSILSGTDDAVGYGVENAEDNTASLITSAKGSVPATRRRRQLAGEGSASNSILSGTDNAVGYGVDDAEDNAASLITSTKGSAAAPANPKSRRQLDKIVNGAGAVADAAGAESVGSVVSSTGDSADGTLTSGAANAGAQVSQTEETTVEGVGSSVPRAKRQADKIADGTAAVLTAAGAPAVAGQEQSTGDAVDGQLTGDAADAGAQVASDEVTVAEQAGSDVPSKVPSRH